MTVNDTTNSLEINLTIRSFLEKWLKAQWISFSGSLIYRNMILFFHSWNIFFSSIFDTDNIIHYLEYVLTHHWTCTYFNLYFISIFSLVISEGSKSFDETELFINSSAELKKCNGHLWGVSYCKILIEAINYCLFWGFFQLDIHKVLRAIWN